MGRLVFSFKLGGQPQSGIRCSGQGRWEENSWATWAGTSPHAGGNRISRRNRCNMRRTCKLCRRPACKRAEKWILLTLERQVFYLVKAVISLFETTHLIRNCWLLCCLEWLGLSIVTLIFFLFAVFFASLKRNNCGSKHNYFPFFHAPCLSSPVNKRRCEQRCVRCSKQLLDQTFVLE